MPTQGGTAVARPALVDRECLEQRELATLAPYAVCSLHSRGRVQPEAVDEWRTCFQRDRDRIVHSRAFRRLAHKTQVQPLPGSDHVRTRLTHSLEVAQIGRSVARRLNVNEDLVEAICLAHDLGHPPFGHEGEHTLNELLSEAGGFDHNLFTFELLDVRERRRPHRPGLNLTYEVREGVLKHGSAPSARQIERVAEEGLRPWEAASLEAQISNLADEIAYNSSDLDDLMRFGGGNGERLAGAVRELEVYRRIRAHAASRELEEADLDSSTSRKVLITEMVGQAIGDCVEATVRNLQRCHIRSVADVRRCGDRPLVCLDSELESMYGELRWFLTVNFYRTHKVRVRAEEGVDAIRRVFAVLVSEPSRLPPAWRGELDCRDRRAVVGAYIATMTDRFLLDLDARLR